jgi:hypothetical protein
MGVMLASVLTVTAGVVFVRGSIILACLFAAEAYFGVSNKKIPIKTPVIAIFFIPARNEFKSKLRKNIVGATFKNGLLQESMKNKRAEEAALNR